MTEPHAPKVRTGSRLSRLRQGVRKTGASMKSFFEDKKRTKTQKLKNIGTRLGEGYMHATISALNTAFDPKAKLKNRVPAGIAGVVGGIAGSAGVLGAAGIAAGTTALGATTRGLAPAIGAQAGLALGTVKGALELPTRSVYGIGKALYHSPTAAVRGIKYSLAKKAFRRRTGFSNQTLSKIQTLEAKRNKANSNLEELIAKQDKKLAEINPADTQKIERKQAKYKAQREKLQAKLENREAKLQSKTRRALNKTRTAKAKRGETTDFTLNTTRRTQIKNIRGQDGDVSEGKQRADRLGILQKLGETPDALHERLKYREGESVEVFKKRTGIEFLKGESEEAYKSRVGITGETNEAYGKRIGVIKKDDETPEAYKARLNSLKDKGKKQEGETNTAYLKRRLQEQYESQQKAYNEVITAEVKEKQKTLKQEIGEEQTRLATSEAQLTDATKTIENYKSLPKKDQKEQRKQYLEAITKRARATADINRQQLVIAQKNKKLLDAIAEEKRLINTKGLNAKRGSMERRRARLEESKQNLTAAGRHIISPVTSAVYGGITGYRAGTVVGQQALKFGSFGMIKEKIDSNSGTGIRESFNRARNLGLGTTKKQKKNTDASIQEISSNLLAAEVATKKTIKSKGQNQLIILKSKLENKQIELNNNIAQLDKLRKNPKLSIQQQLQIDNLISQLREKNKRYAKAILRINKRLPAADFRTAAPGGTSSNRRYSTKKENGNSRSRPVMMSSSNSGSGAAASDK